MDDINTYGDLKSAVASWLNRRDDATLNKIPLFINFATKQFTRLMKLPYYESRVYLNAVEGKDFVNIPNDFLSAKHIMVNGVPQTRVDTDTFQRLKSETGTQRPPEPRDPITGDLVNGNTGRIVIGGTDNKTLAGATTAKENFFMRVGDQLHFLPALTPDDVVEMIYRRDIPEMKDDADSPYFLLVASDVMLYLTLRHAAIFLRDNEQEAYWNQKATEAAAALQEQLDEAEWSGSSLVVPMFYS